MKRILPILVAILLFQVKSQAQATWERLIVNHSSDAFRSVQEVPGGGFVAAGYIADSSVNDTDAYVVRFDPNGDTLWSFSYNGPMSQKDLFYKIINTSDGGFITCGYSTSFSGASDDMFYLKLNSSGHMQWVKSFGGNGKERAQDIVETSNGYTVAGYSTSPPAQYYDALVLHLNANGDTLWTKLIGMLNYDDANTIKLLPDGGYILGGQSNNGANGLDLFLIRLDSDGDTVWTRRFGTLQTDNIESIAIDGGNYVLAGSTNDIVNGDDGYIVKTDTSGGVIWSKNIGGIGPDDFHRIEKTTDGGFILAGTTSSFGPALPNMWIVKTDATGDTIWTCTFGGDNHDHGYSAIEASDGTYVLAGHSGSFGFHSEDAYIVKLGANCTINNRLMYIAAFALDSPLCSSTNSEVRIVLRNFGNEPATNIDLTVNITGGLTQTVTATVPGPFVPGDATIVPCTPLINTSGVGPLTFHAYTSTTNDVYPSSNSFTQTVTLSACNGIDELKHLPGISLYPNPSRGKLTVDFSKLYTNALVEIFNSIGEKMESSVWDHSFGSKHTIDLSSHARGIYLVKIATVEGFDVRKVVIE